MTSANAHRHYVFRMQLIDLLDLTTAANGKTTKALLAELGWANRLWPGGGLRAIPPLIVHGRVKSSVMADEEGVGYK